MNRETPPAPVGMQNPLLAELFGGEEKPIDLFAYWRILLKHKWGILGLALSVGVVAGLYAYSLEPQYQASATVLVNMRGAQYSPVKSDVAGEGFAAYWQGRNFFETQIRLMRSRSVAETVITKLELWRHPEFDPRQARPERAPLAIEFDWREWFPFLERLPEEARPQMTDEEVKQAILGRIAGGLSVSQIPNADIMQVSYQSRDPKLAAAIANAYAETYIEIGMESRLEVVRKAGEWLTKKMEGVKEKLDESERRLIAFKEQHGILTTEGTALANVQVDRVAGELAQARAELLEIESQARSASSVQSLGMDALSRNPVLVENSALRDLQRRVEAAESNASTLSTRYGPRHPNMIKAQEELRIAREQLQREVQLTSASKDKSVTAARGRVQRLEEELAKLQSQVGETNRKAFQLQELQRDVAGNRELYELFMTRFKETNLGVDVESSNAQIIDAATPPGGPFAPNREKIIGTAAAAALALGILLAFMLERMDATFKSGDDVEDKLGLPVLSSLPILTRRRKQEFHPERAFIREPKSSFSESIRTVRSGILLTGLDNPNKLLLVTSTVPGEGKSTVATNLAIALGQLENVLLIDCDMRRASVGRQFGLPKDTPGLSDFIAGTRELKECIHRMPEDHIDILPSGSLPPNPLELLSSKRFASFLEKLTKVYDRVVIDSAPTQAVSDAVVLSKLVNTVLYVVRADATPYPLAQGGVKRLRQVNAHIVGAVLNQQDPKKSTRYYGKYGKYGRYNYYYDRYYQHDYYSAPEKA